MEEQPLSPLYRPTPPPTAPLALNVNELAALLHALLDSSESALERRIGGARVWRSDDGRAEVRRIRHRHRPAQLFRQDARAIRSRVSLAFDGVCYFEHTERVWTDALVDVAECAQVEIPRGCFDRVMAYHREHGTWIVGQYTAPAEETARVATIPRAPRVRASQPRHSTVPNVTSIRRPDDPPARCDDPSEAA